MKVGITISEVKEVPLRILGARCIVKEHKLDAKTQGGIIIPGREKQSTNRGTVVRIGPGAMLDDGTVVPMDVQVGDTVVYASFAGSPVQVEDTVYIILNERDILCIVE